MDERDCRLMMCLSDLQDCSWMDPVFFNSVVGRHVYHCLERSIYSDVLGFGSSKSIKWMVPSGNFTDRAIRLKLSELERNNYIAKLRVDSDLRSKFIQPTEKFMCLVEDQKKRCRSILEKNFIILER